MSYQLEKRSVEAKIKSLLDDVLEGYASVNKSYGFGRSKLSLR